MLMLKAAWLYGNDALPWHGTASAASETGPVGTSGCPRSQQFPFAFPSVHPSHNSLLKWLWRFPSHLPPLNHHIVTKTKDPGWVFLLRWIFGKWAGSCEHECYEVQLPSHKAFSWSSCSSQLCLIQRFGCSYFMATSLTVAFASWCWVLCFQHPPPIFGKFLFIIQVPGKPVWFWCILP